VFAVARILVDGFGWGAVLRPIPPVLVAVGAWAGDARGRARVWAGLLLSRSRWSLARKRARAQAAVEANS
jgi:hypothetical protein